uniref:Putative precatalytic spliceosome n=1 Tax=Anopheles aquasalis TaxID=42839 RepID=T1DN90_ANOAQ
MLSLQGYGSSGSDGESETDQASASERRTETVTSTTAHLKPPVDNEYSVAKTLAVCAAPLVVPMGQAEVSRALEPTVKEINYNPGTRNCLHPLPGPKIPFSLSRCAHRKHADRIRRERSH